MSDSGWDPPKYDDPGAPAIRFGLPLVVDAFLYDSMGKGLEQVSQSCNALEELLARDGLRDVLGARLQTSSAASPGTALAGYGAYDDYLILKTLGNFAAPTD